MNTPFYQILNQKWSQEDQSELCCPRGSEASNLELQRKQELISQWIRGKDYVWGRENWPKYIHGGDNYGGLF